MSMILDKHGREVKEGDLLKIFHFTTSRKRKVYMYKIVAKLSTIKPETNKPYLLVLVDINQVFNPVPHDIRNLASYDFEIIHGNYAVSKTSVTAWYERPKHGEKE